MPLPKKVKDLIVPLNLIPHPEGGFFVEIYRSGSVPMTSKGQTDLECQDPNVNLVVTKGRANNRPDKNENRNALTSIYWASTKKCPKLHLTRNCSDIVHYYHGGIPFTYTIFDPVSQKLTKITLGPELHKGQTLQYCVRGGLWKCGLLDDNHGGNDSDYDYCLLGEAVAPGFDFYDFNWVTKDELTRDCKDDAILGHLLEFIYEDSTQQKTDNKIADKAAEFYEDDDKQEERKNQRS